MQRIIGIVCLVVGGILIYLGYHMSQAVGPQINNFFSGSPGSKPILCYVGGAILAVLGIGQIAWRTR